MMDLGCHGDSVPFDAVLAALALKSHPEQWLWLVSGVVVGQSGKWAAQSWLKGGLNRSVAPKGQGKW